MNISRDARSHGPTPWQHKLACSVCVVCTHMSNSELFLHACSPTLLNHSIHVKRDKIVEESRVEKWNQRLQDEGLMRYF